jgi:hypothetical protein
MNPYDSEALNGPEVNAYHTALGDPVPALPRLRVRRPSGLALVHDIVIAPLPAEYAQCDVLYTDLPWNSGFQEFEERAGAPRGRSYSLFLGAVRRLVQYSSLPTILITGQHAVPHLPVPSTIEDTTLNGRPCVQLNYRIELPQRFANTVELLTYLAGRYRCIGDFCCGYGRAGRIFAEHGRRFVMSDYNATCIGYIGDNL